MPLNSTKKLKDPRTCRVFVSSPFGGFEEEREEFVVKYFPQLSHMCQSKGVQFVTVDMRWGITEEAATDAQVVNICLREVDRSDIFVGLYGQRYGWHGEKDEMLQKNIENAIERYPWLKSAKDRSVTEMEFLHGHLNNPGELPSIFAFRDKAYDEAERTKAEKAKDQRQAQKFMAESDNSKTLLDNLKAKVAKTADKCLALKENYKTPQEGAQFVFEQLTKYLNEVLKTPASISKRDTDLASHNAYLLSRATIFVGGENNKKALDLALQKGGQNVIITGPTGSGKGALLAHWISGLTKKKSPYSLIYHFVDCTTDSANISEILTRLTEEINHVTGDVKKYRSESLNQIDEDVKPKSKDVSDLYQEFEKTLNQAAANHKILLAIDGLGKVLNASRTSKIMFWIPKELPSNVTMVVTCRDQDKDVIDEMSARGFTKLHIPELSTKCREEMCKALLTHNSKELAATQLKNIVESKQTGSPLYLKTVITELCAFGKFRELGDKILELTACKSVKELFQVFIKRLEDDYITDKKKGNIIEEVLCSLRVSRKGLSEKELMAIHNFSSAEWSPLFFAMQHVIDEMAGLIKLGSNELIDAVDEKYLKKPNIKQKYQKLVADYFEKQRKEEDDMATLDDASLLRPSEELPWLLHAMGDKKRLIEVLSDLSIFGRLFLDQEFELMELWRFTGLSGEQIADLYLKAVQVRGNKISKATAKNPSLKNVVMVTLISYLNALTYFMEMASYKAGEEKVLMAQMKILNDSGGDLLPDFVNRNQASVKTKLAYLYTDTGRYERASALHREVLDYRTEFLNKAKGEGEKVAALRGIGASYHGIAMLNSKLDKVEEAIEYYTKAMEVQKQLEDEVELADSLHNLGVMYMKIGRYDQAVDLCQKSLKIYEKIYFANLPPVIGIMIGNIAVCYRNLGQVAEAEKMYEKAIEISERSVGRQHPNVALGLMNIGTLEINRQQFSKAEAYLRESMEIFDKCDILHNDPDYYRSLEKFTYVLIKVNKIPEALTNFQKLFNIAVKEKLLDSCWPIVYLAAVDCLIEVQKFQLAKDVTLAMLQSKQVQDRHYVHYDLICRALKQKPKPEFSVEKAYKKNPGSLNLLRQVMDTIYIPEQLLSKIITALDETDGIRKVGTDLYGTAVVWCQEASKPEMAIGVLEHAVTKFPDEANFVYSLAQKYYDKQEFEKAFPYAEKICTLEPTNPNGFMMCGDAAIRCKKFPEARRIFNDMLVKFAKNDSVASQARKALDIITTLETKGGSLAPSKS